MLVKFLPFIVVDITFCLYMASACINKYWVSHNIAEIAVWCIRLCQLNMPSMPSQLKSFASAIDKATTYLDWLLMSQKLNLGYLQQRMGSYNPFHC
jgi:hypothetical protein